MSGVNKVIIMGRLGQDPEIKQTNNGSSVCNFSLATSETWKDKNSGEKQEKTEWHKVVVYGKLADLCGQYLAKGRQAFVEGKISTNKWQDKDGNDRYTTQIVASTVQFIGGSSDQKPQSSEGSQDSNSASEADFASDDIPF